MATEQKSYDYILKVEAEAAKGLKKNEKNPARFVVLDKKDFFAACAKAKKQEKNIVEHLLGEKYDKDKQRLFASMFKGDPAHHHENVKEHGDEMHNAGMRRFVGMRLTSGKITVYAECPGALVKVGDKERILHGKDCTGIVKIDWANFRERFRNDDCNNLMKKKSAGTGGDPLSVRVESLKEDKEALLELNMIADAENVQKQIDKLEKKIAANAKKEEEEKEVAPDPSEL